jgi:LuxR family maltose regulon positive regulatory protein
MEYSTMHTGDVSSPVKITKPRVTGIVHRKRLFRALDSARRPILWITGPAGSGKTSLIGSYVDARKLPCLWYQIDSRDGDVATFFYYLGLAVKKAAPHYRKPLPLLTPEYLLDLTTFTKRYFEELFKRLKQPGVLVFDNYQDVPLDSVFHDVIRDALSTVPENIRVIAISRSDPAPKLARLRVEREMVSMGWKDVRFTLEESKMLVASCRKEVPLKAPIEQLYRQTDGWAAGLVLMSRAPLVASARTDLPAWQTPSELFDYFAGELFDKTDAGTRDFLLCTSFLPTFTASMAQLLSGSEQAARLLAHLQRNNFFITSSADSVYQYHPLFREFLSVRAREIFSKEYLAKIQQSAASILKDNGRPEDAAELFREAEDWQLFIELTMEQAPSLVAKGRLQTLSTWLTAIPEQQFADSPWLWYWLGTCRVPFDPKEGLRHFENAFELFQTQGDMRGALLAWSGAVNAVLLGWDDFSPLNSLINWFYERADSITFPSTEMEAECASSMAGAMVWRQPDHPDIGEWVERALNLTRKSENFALKLQAHIHASNYYLWVGDISNALLVDKEMQEMTRGPAVSPLMLIACKWLEAGTSYLAADSGLWHPCLGQYGLWARSVRRSTQGRSKNSLGVSEQDESNPEGRPKPRILPLSLPGCLVQRPFWRLLQSPFSCRAFPEARFGDPGDWILFPGDTLPPRTYEYFV